MPKGRARGIPAKVNRRSSSTLIIEALWGVGARSSKEKLVGQKAPLKLKDIWAIPVRLQITDRTRDLALFNLAIDSKLRVCDLVEVRVRDISHGERAAGRAIVMQQKT